MEETMSLQQLFKTLKKRIVFILSISILAVLITGAISYFFLTPIYSASTQILITQQKYGQNQFNAQDIETNLQLINTYTVIIKSPAILSKVIEEMDLNTTPILLEKNIRVNSEQNSQVVTVSVRDPNAQQAINIANTTAEVFQKEVRTLMNIDNVNILSPAVQIKNPIPIMPNPILYMIIAAIIGLMLGVGIALLVELLDTTVKTEQDIEDVLALPLLGLVSPIKEKDSISKIEARNRRKKGNSQHAEK